MLLAHNKTMIKNGRYFFLIILIIFWDILVTFLTTGSLQFNDGFLLYKSRFYINVCLFVILWSYFRYHFFLNNKHFIYIFFILLILTQLTGFIFLHGWYLYEFAPDTISGRKLNLYFADANYLAAYIVLLYSLFFYVVHHSKIATLIGYVIAFILVVLTYSRAGIILMAITGVFCLNRLLYNKQIADSLRKVVLMIAVTIIVVWSLYHSNILFQNISARFTYNRLYGESRLDIWKFALKNMSITGIGMGTFETFLYPHTTYHNFYFELMVGLGVSALIILKIFFAKIRKAFTVFPLLHLNLFIISFFFSFSFVSYAWFFWAFLSAYRHKNS